jgi:GT2 family glycosyltransferase
VLFTDADCEPLPDWIERMLEGLSDPAVVGVKGAYVTEQTAPVARFVQLEYEEKYARMARFPRIDFIDTYSAGFRKEPFWAVGGYDEAYPNPSVEDQEFSFRLARAGYELRFLPAARVRHRHADRLWRYARKKFNIGYWKIRLLRRHPGKALHDTHTPQVLKLQILLLGVAVCAGMAALVPAWRGGALVLAAGGVGGFLVSTLPMCRRIRRRDPALAWRAPLYLAVRALALGAGMVAGAAALLRGGGRR